jgi:hypothetical protein
MSLIKESNFHSIQMGNVVIFIYLICSKERCDGKRIYFLPLSILFEKIKLKIM